MCHCSGKRLEGGGILTRKLFVLAEHGIAYRFLLRSDSPERARQAVSLTVSVCTFRSRSFELSGRQHSMTVPEFSGIAVRCMGHT